MKTQSTKRVDMLGKRCQECEIGTYQETSIFDDWEGVLHCTKCGHEEVRWKEVQRPLTDTAN